MLLQQLALLKGFDLAALDPNGAEFVHVVTECSKLAFADREAFYGDPAFAEIPLQTLFSDGYNGARRALVGKDASLELRPGLPEVSGRRLKTMLALSGSAAPVGPGGGEPTFAPLPEYRGDTVHLDVIDRWGNMIAATPSGGWFQSSPIIPALGFPLGTRAQMFWLAEDLPSSLSPARGPARRCRRPWWSATANRTSSAARPAAISRTSGRPCCYAPLPPSLEPPGSD